MNAHVHMTGPPAPALASAPPTASAKEFAKKTRRAIAAIEQSLAASVFTPPVATWTAGLQRMGGILTDADRSPVQTVKELMTTVKAMQRAGNTDVFHRVEIRAQGKRTLDMRIEALGVGPHPLRGVDDGSCIYVLRADFSQARRGASFMPAPLLAFSTHALERLSDRTNTKWPVEAVAKLCFRLAHDAERVLHRSGSRFQGKEILLPIPGTDAVAAGVVRRSEDMNGLMVSAWLDLRTVLERRLLLREQRQHVKAVAALLAAIEAGTSEQDLIPLRMAVPPLGLKTTDYVSRRIDERRSAKRAEHRGGGKPKLTLAVDAAVGEIELRGKAT